MTPIHHLLACAALAATGTAVAQTAAAPTRADVKAEARAAVKSGATAEGETKDTGASSPQAASDKSRGQVRREARAAVRSGETAEGERGAARGETSYSGPPRAARASSGKSRAEARGEARAAARAGTDNDTASKSGASYTGPEKSASAVAR